MVRPAPEWWVKIGDFGISKRHANTGLYTEMGTRLFLAPEVQMLYPPEVDESSMFIYTNKVDIWSLGVITFYMLFHEYPFTLAKPTALPIYARGGPFPFPSNPQASRKCYGFMKATMAADASVRLSATQAQASDWLKQESVGPSDGDSETAILDKKDSTCTHDALRSCYDRAIEFLQQKKYSVAQHLLQQVVDGWSESLGPTHGDVIEASFVLSDTYYHLHDHEKAEIFLRRALDCHQAQLGLIDDMTPGATTHPRATIWEVLGGKEAGIFLRQAVQSAKQIYGPDGSKTLKLLFWQGQALCKQRKYTQAKAIHEEVLKRRKETLGPSHPETLEVIEALCNTQGSDFRGTESLWRCWEGLRLRVLTTIR